ncbi:hypothetical protein PED39_06990 [Methanomassiliicoccales archaeon LGM-RCC1]|nr:hypothetical protein PED39_06990 [Methanomassiliicoccales archaeon LGM-RCC1]
MDRHSLLGDGYELPVVPSISGLGYEAERDQLVDDIDGSMAVLTDVVVDLRPDMVSIPHEVVQYLEDVPLEHTVAFHTRQNLF